MTFQRGPYDPRPLTALLAGLADDRAVVAISTDEYSLHTNRSARLEEALWFDGQRLSPNPWLYTFVGSSNAQSVPAQLPRSDGWRFQSAKCCVVGLDVRVPGNLGPAWGL